MALPHVHLQRYYPSKIFDCLECGEVFKTKSDLYNHLANKHSGDTFEITSLKEVSVDQVADVDQELSQEVDFDDYYKMETNPKEVDNEEKIVGYTFTGESDEYKKAKETIEGMMSKPKGKYVFEGREISVKIVPKIRGGKIALEVTGLNGKVGSLALRCYCTKK